MKENELRDILDKLYYSAYRAGQQVGDDQEDMDNPEEIDSALSQIIDLIIKKLPYEKVVTSWPGDYGMGETYDGFNDCLTQVKSILNQMRGE